MELPIGRAPMKEKSVELWGHGDAEQQFQLDVCGLVVMSFGDNSGKCKFLFSLLMSDLQFQINKLVITSDIINLLMDVLSSGTNIIFYALYTLSQKRNYNTMYNKI